MFLLLFFSHGILEQGEEASWRTLNTWPKNIRFGRPGALQTLRAIRLSKRNDGTTDKLNMRAERPIASSHMARKFLPA